MKAYLWAFVNFEQNNWVKLLQMAEYAYNNARNASNGQTPFEMNCGYHSHIFFEEETFPCFQPKIADELSAKLQKIMTVCWENFHHA